MLEDERAGANGAADTTESAPLTPDVGDVAARPRRRRAAVRAAGPPAPADVPPVGDSAPAPVADAPDAAPEKPKRSRRSTKKISPPDDAASDTGSDGSGATSSAEWAGTPLDTEPGSQTSATIPAEEAASRPKRTRARRPAKTAQPAEIEPPADLETPDEVPPSAAGTALLFKAAEPAQPPRRRSRPKAATPADDQGPLLPGDATTDEGRNEVAISGPAAPATAPAAEPGDQGEEAAGEAAADSDDTERGRRRRRGGRGRRSRGRTEALELEAEFAATSAQGQPDEDGVTPEVSEDDAPPLSGSEDVAEDDSEAAGSRRRRRRRRKGGNGEDEEVVDESVRTVVHVRDSRKRAERPARAEETGVAGVKGSTRLEAKKQRRREGRDQGRRRPPIITEAEFLARRESVERVMVVRQIADRTQIAVLEDGVLVEHYVNRASSTSFVGNVYLGKVQNVLPSMEAAFIDIGKGRNAVLYAGEVNWDAAGLEGQAKRIESALKAGDSVLVQVTKDPIGHKGARLTSQISLPGRFLVYVPEGSMTGISRKLPDNERNRLKSVLKAVVPDESGVIVRTAAEGATEEELTRDVNRLQAQWEDIRRKSATASAPALLYGEPDLTIRVIRDVFNEDFTTLLVSGDEAWDTVAPYVEHVAPDLVDRIERWNGESDVWSAHRVDEQLAKALDRKVWLPSGGSLVIDRTEAMVVVDVNTGKFTGKGGNLEETVTKNNLEAAEEIVRQLRLRDLGGIIVIDFIDMVLESNRELVLRRLLECLGRDRTKHQVAEVTSLGLVQMTRKRVGQGLLEAFSEVCDCCNGRGLKVSMEPVGIKSNGSGAADGDGDAPDSDGPPLTRLRPAVLAPVSGPASPASLVPAAAPNPVVGLLGAEGEEFESIDTGRPKRRRASRKAATISPPTGGSADTVEQADAGTPAE